MRVLIAVAFVVVAACEPQTSESASPAQEQKSQNAEESQRRPDDQPVRQESPQPVAGDVVYWKAPASEFEAIEPTVLGIVGAPAVWDALAPLGRWDLTADAAPETLDAHIRVEGGGLVADVLRANLADDAISTEHVRIEFRREPEGWFPTNAYRRHKCRRAKEPAAWSTAPCP